MDLSTTLTRLAEERNEPCISISLNTHRTHPDHLKDEIELKNLVKEAQQRIKEEFESSEVSEVLEKLEKIHSKIDFNHLIDSLHIFISKDTEEILKSIWPVKENAAYVDNHFAIRPVIMEYNNLSDYLILKLTQGATHLYSAINDKIEQEIENHVFPFGEKAHFEKTNIQRSDAEFMDTMIREHFRDIDKALADYIKNEKPHAKVVVITAEDNYSKLQEVAVNSEIYLGYADISHLEKSPHQLAKQAWEIILEHQKLQREKAVDELKSAVSEAKVLTDLKEIFLASMDGRADLLVVNKEFKQPVRMVDERTFEYGNDPKEQGVDDDITTKIAWKVIKNGGRVVFTDSGNLGELGDIALKTRY